MTMHLPSIKRSKKSGLPPGTPVYIGETVNSPVKIHLIDYDEESFQEKELEKIEDAFAFKDTASVSWINVSGVHQVDVIEKIGKHFDLHSLVIEDIANTEQRPKVEDYGDYLFIVLKMLSVDSSTKIVKTEQVSLVLGKNYVLSFQQDVGDVFDNVRSRIRTGKSKIRKLGTDFLVYSLMDAIVDNYFGVLEQLGDDVEQIEDLVVKGADSRSISSVYKVKQQMIGVRKALWPLREMISQLQNLESSLIGKSSTIYLRDMYDHSVQLIDTVETLRERLSELIDIYLSSQSNRLNEIMKVLTVITTMFIPLTFVTSIYGMNFAYMPELSWSFGYPVILGIMLFIVLIMLIYFKRKKWI